MNNYRVNDRERRLIEILRKVSAPIQQLLFLVIESFDSSDAKSKVRLSVGDTAALARTAAVLSRNERGQK